MSIKRSTKILLTVGVLAVLLITIPGCSCLRESVNRELVIEGAVKEVWLKYHSKGYSAIGSAIVMDNKGNIYVAGNNSDLKSGNSSIGKYNSDGKKLWASDYGGTPEAIDLDSSGNIYVTGTSYNDTTGYDYLTAKYDNNGKELWKQYFNGHNYYTDSPTGMALDHLGNVYVTGYSSLSVISSLEYADYACVTIKYDTSGKELWTASYDGPLSFKQAWGGVASWHPRYDIRDNIVTDTSGNVYITGSSTVMYDTDGNELWRSADYTWSRYLSAYDIATDSSGYVYVVGDSQLLKYSKEGDQIWSVGANGKSINIDRLGDIYIGNDTITKYDSNGSEIWTVTPDSSFIAITLDNLGNVYVCGYPCAIAKYDSNGIVVWSIKYEDDNPHCFSGQYNDLVVDESGNVYVTGRVALAVKETVNSTYPFDKGYETYYAFAIAKYGQES